MQPVKIRVSDKKLQITWEDESLSEIKLANLRRNCPCAECDKEKSLQSKTYIPIYSDEEVTIQKIQPIGNYALGISWKDNHNTGIYDYSYLQILSNGITN